eukprot:2191454-Ditylum_brightwellii.AAC.1
MKVYEENASNPFSFNGAGAISYMNPGLMHPMMGMGMMAMANNMVGLPSTNHGNQNPMQNQAQFQQFPHMMANHMMMHGGMGGVSGGMRGGIDGGFPF